MNHVLHRKGGVASAALAMAMLSAVALPNYAFAADAPQADTPAAPAAAAADTAPGDTIIVTGSRIRRPEAASSVPIAVVGAGSIEAVGQTNLLDALRDLPIAGQSAGRSASNFSNSGNCTATVNLRNLGPTRTLVLINGRRSVGIPGGSAVDLNNIPTQLIDHVEIVTGGASAVYGSDAVAGVVNIILKDKFSGLELHAQDMLSGHGDGDSVLLSGTAGTDFSGGAGHVVANFSYTKDNAIPSSARSFSQNDSPTGSAYTPQGVFEGANGNYTFDANNNVIPYTGSAAQRYNRASQRLLVVPVERYSASLLAHYDFGPAAQLYGEFMYDKTKASGHIEPLAVDDGGNQGQSVFNFDGSAFPGISASNPYMPAAIKAAAGEGGYVDFLKRSNGIFDRSPHDDRDYFRGVIGLKGALGSDWSYDASYEHSQVRDDTTNGAILMNNYGAALQATTIDGQIVCADATARAAGCVPINPFGHQAYTPAQLKWLTTYSGQGQIVPGATAGQSVDAEFLQKNYQDVATVAITGSLFRLPNGPLGIAAGAEYHHEHVSEVYDPFTASGTSSQQLNGNEYGTINAKEAFVELNAPIFGDHPGVYALSLEGAARYAHYSTVGSVWTYKYGGTYAPVQDIRFRAVYARAVRAPNLNELYSPQANTAQQVVDPCDQYQGGGETATAVALPAGCANIPAIANYLKTHQVFGYTLAQVQTIFGLVGGNQNLHAEATNTFTAGASITPRFLRNFLLTADYYTIKVKNAVATVDPQTAVSECFNTGNPDFCNLVHRNANGFITEVDGVNINAASYLVSGVDIRAIYGIKSHFLNPSENWNFDLYYNHKFKQQQTPFAGGPVSNELGTADTYASQQLGTGFKDQFTLNVNYATGRVTLNYRLKYLGPVSASSGLYQIPAYTYHDIQMKFDVAKKYQFYFGVNNLLDKDPPFIKSGNSQWPGTNTVADTYDVMGRMFYAGVTAKF
jgi:outer membrane receptor protein involved in Fe transport